MHFAIDCKISAARISQHPGHLSPPKMACHAVFQADLPYSINLIASSHLKYAHQRSNRCLLLRGALIQGHGGKILHGICR
jgi:hypothetical protein